MEGRKLNVLQVTRQYKPSIGGIERAVEGLSHALIERGHNVSVLALDRLWEDRLKRLPNHEVIDGIEVHRVGFGGSKRYALAPSVLDSLSDFDLIHIHSSDFFLDYLAMMHWLHQKPMVLTSHGFYFHTPFFSRSKRLYFSTMTRLALKAVKTVICVSQQDYDRAKQIVPKEKLALIPNGLNLHFPEEVVKDPRLVLTVGRLAENKRLDRLLEAFALVVRMEPEAWLEIIGKDHGQVVALRSQVKRLKLEGCVRLRGEVPDSLLARQLAAARVWVSASAYEGYGIGLLEAMAAGCVPVVSRIAAFEELVEHEKSGYLTDFNNSAGAAEQIVQAIRLPENKREMLVSANKTKVESHQWSTIAGQVEQVYFRAAGGDK